VRNTKTERWKQELKKGVLEVTNLQILGTMTSEAVLTELRSIFPILFLEGRKQNKLEIGLAQRRKGHRYQRCVIVTFEFDRLTSLASMTYLRIRRSATQPRARELASGAGFNLFRDLDAWKVKLLEERKVALPDASLRRRGWSICDS